MTGKTVSSIIEPHKELLVDMIPPKKHLLKHQPINTQIALMVWIHDDTVRVVFFPFLILSSLSLSPYLFLPLFCLSLSVSLSQDGYTFCCNLSPRLFSINLSVQEHKVFFQEVRPCTVLFWSHFYSFLPLQLITLCGEGDDAVLAKSPCYKGVQSLIPLKINGLGNDCTELHHIMTAKYYLFFSLPLPPFSLSLSLSLSLSPQLLLLPALIWVKWERGYLVLCTKLLTLILSSFRMLGRKQWERYTCQLLWNAVCYFTNYSRFYIIITYIANNLFIGY